MRNEYSLTLRQARVCRWASALFLLAAAFTVVDIGFTAVWAGSILKCNGGEVIDRCQMVRDSLALVPEDERAAIAASAQARVKFDAYVDRTDVRLGVLGVEAVAKLPLVVLLMAVGIALRRLVGRTADNLGRALPWLRGAALAAIVLALVRGIGNSLSAMLFYPGTPGGAYWYLEVDPFALFYNVLLALAAYAAIWALEAGHRAERDLAEIV